MTGALGVEGPGVEVRGRLARSVQRPWVLCRHCLHTPALSTWHTSASLPTATACIPLPEDLLLLLELALPPIQQARVSRNDGTVTPTADGNWWINTAVPPLWHWITEACSTWAFRVSPAGLHLPQWGLAQKLPLLAVFPSMPDFPDALPVSLQTLRSTICS